MIPPFQPDGNLPPGIHTATWEEVVARFGGNPQRNRLLDGLRRAIDNLQSAGCRRLYLNGSFTTSKPDPDDYDGCWEMDGVDLSRVFPIFLDPDDQRWNGRQRQKAQFGGELIAEGLYWLGVAEFFQKDEQENPKGVILIELGAISDESSYD